MSDLPIGELNQYATEALRFTCRHANAMRHVPITTAHLIAGTAHRGPAANLLHRQLDITLLKLTQTIEKLDLPKPSSDRFQFSIADQYGYARYTPGAIRVIKKAVQIARTRGRDTAGAEEIFLGTVEVFDEHTEQLFKMLELDKTRLEDAAFLNAR